MKAVVANLGPEDYVNILAYTASRPTQSAGLKPGGYESLATRAYAISYP